MFFFQWIELSYTRNTIAHVKLLVEWVTVKTAVHANIHGFIIIVYIYLLYINIYFFICGSCEIARDWLVYIINLECPCQSVSQSVITKNAFKLHFNLRKLLELGSSNFDTLWHTYRYLASFCYFFEFAFCF